MAKLLSSRRRMIKRLLILILIIVSISFILIYSSFIYYAPCKDESCFFAHLKNCDRAIYSKPGELILKYKIIGLDFSSCRVDVYLQNNDGKTGLGPSYSGKSMTCYLKFGSEYYPEEDLGNCSGILREGLQEVLIDRLKVEVVKNIGEINLDILNG